MAAEIRSVAQALLAHVPSRPAGLPALATKDRHKRAAIVADICHSGMGAGGNATHTPTARVEDAAVHATAGQGSHRNRDAALCSGAAWTPGRRSPTVKPPRLRAFAMDAPAMPPPRRCTVPTIAAAASSRLSMRPSATAAGVGDADIDAGGLWLQGSAALTPALTPEDSFAAIASPVGAAGRSRQALHAEDSSGSTAALPALASVPVVGRPGRLRRGGAATGTHTSAGLCFHDQGVRTQLVGMMREMLLSPSRGPGERQLRCSGDLQSVHSVNSKQNGRERGGRSSDRDAEVR